MAARPYHLGHDMLIRIAARDNDEVHVYASMSDRENVSGAAMEKVWNELIKPTLPGNVDVILGGNPVTNVFVELGEANEAKSKDFFTVYSDDIDIGKFNVVQKYAGDLIAGGQIILRGIKRSETVDVSGTQMRQWLAQGDKESFVSKLPRGIDGDVMWHVLTTVKPTTVVKKKVKSNQTETLLRDFVKTVIITKG